MGALTIVIFIAFFALILLLAGIVQFILGLNKNHKKLPFKLHIFLGIVFIFPSACTAGTFLINSVEQNNKSNSEKGQLILSIDSKDIMKINQAIKKSNINEIRKFVVGSYYEYHTPLSYACFLNNYDIAKILIFNGSDVNKNVIWDSEQNFESLTPLVYACKNNNLELIRLLIENGADLQKTIKGKTIIDTVRETSNDEVLSLLLSYQKKDKKSNTLINLTP